MSVPTTALLDEQSLYADEPRVEQADMQASSPDHGVDDHSQALRHVKAE